MSLPASPPGPAPRRGDEPAPTAHDAPFSRRALGWIVGVATASFLLALGLGIFAGDLGRVPTSDAGAYSRSALGHAGFVKLLRGLGVPVVLSQYDSAQRAGEASVLVIAEPQLGDAEQRAALGDMLQDAGTVVLVLPKRRGEEDPEKRAWIVRSRLEEVYEVEAVLAAAGIGGSIVRLDAGDAVWTTTELAGGARPTLSVPQLVVDAPDLEPLVATDDGILVGEIVIDEGDDGEKHIIVVADPDLLANHGLDDGDNAALAYAAVEHVRAGKTVVVDETLHGHVSPPSLWRELFAFPLSLATFTALGTLAFLLWAAMGRFGKPVPAGFAIAPGKGFLIANTAELLRQGSHAAHALERYFNLVLADVARQTHAPGHLSLGELRGWLRAAGESRKVSVDLAELEREVALVARLTTDPAGRALACAGRIHRFREEMIHGPGKHRGAAR